MSKFNIERLNKNCSLHFTFITPIIMRVLRAYLGESKVKVSVLFEKTGKTNSQKTGI